MEQTNHKVHPGLLTVFILVIIAGIFYFAWYFFNQSRQEDIDPGYGVPLHQNIILSPATKAPTNLPSIMVSPITSPSASVSVIDWKKYTNSTYGFSFTFPGDQWKNYKVFEVTPSDGSATKYIYFALPTTDKNWKESNVGAGFASAMAVAVYTKAQWSQIKDDPIIGAPAGQNDMYVFTIDQAQAAPEDLINTNFGVSKITASFKAE